MRLLITIPAKNQVPALYMKYFNRWQNWIYEFEDATQHKVRILAETTPNRMDVSISKCIQLWKDLRPAWGIRLDMDVWPETPLADCFDRAQELWLQHKAVTGAPTVDSAGILQFKPLDGDLALVQSRRAFPVDWVSGSLVFTPQEVFDALQPVSVYRQDVNGEERSMNLYIALQRPYTTEDNDFCERVRAAGYEVYADPGIEVRQMRESVGVPSYRAPMGPVRPGSHPEFKLPIQGLEPAYFCPNCKQRVG